MQASKIYLFALIMLLFPVLLSGSNIKGAAILKIPENAVLASRATTGIAADDKLNSFSLNPALLSLPRQKEFGISSTFGFHFADFKYVSFNLNTPVFLNKFAFGVNFMYMFTTQFDNIGINEFYDPVFTEDRLKTGHMYLNLAGSYKVADVIPLGASIKVCYENLIDKKITLLLLDTGIILKDILPGGLNIGIVMKNFSFTKNPINYPWSICTGLSKSFLGSRRRSMNIFKLLFDINYIIPNDIDFNCGIEYENGFRYVKLFYRGGISYNLFNKGPFIGLGFGIQFYGIELDYSLSMIPELRLRYGTLHKISLSWRYLK